MYALSHCVLLTGEVCLHNHAVLIQHGLIHAIVPESEIPQGIPVHDLQGHILSAGFIDLQLNGCGGVMFNDAPTLDTLAIMHQTNLKSGTTSFLPTLISDSDEVIRAALMSTRAYKEMHPNQVLGMHLEGPYTNPQRKGIHPIEQLRQPSDDMITWLCQQSDALAKVTLAPEMNQPKHIRQLASAGVLVSLGHSAASYEQAMQAFDDGIQFVTHLHNAMSATENARTPGVVGAVLDRQNIYTGIVADGHHVHWANVRIAKRALTDHLCLVTDATAAAAAPSGFTQFDFCGATIYLKDGQCVDAKGTLGGSALTMNEGIRLLVEQAGISLEEAFRMATLYPARAIKMDHLLGAIQPGMVANLVIIRSDYQVVNTIVNGDWTQG